MQYELAGRRALPVTAVRRKRTSTTGHSQADDSSPGPVAGRGADEDL
jgi:hypothetical protein